MAGSQTPDDVPSGPCIRLDSKIHSTVTSTETLLQKMIACTLGRRFAIQNMVGELDVTTLYNVC